MGWGSRRGAVRLGHYVDWEGRSTYVPVLVEREDGAHIVYSEMTGAVLGRIRRSDKRFRGWTAQAEESGEVMPASSTMTDAVFDLLQHIAERGHHGLGLRRW